MAGVLRETIPRRNGLNAMAEQPAAIPHFLREQLAIGERVGARGIDQRVAALHADVLMSAVAVRKPHVGVVPEKTGERVANVRQRPVLTEVLDAATASAFALIRDTEELVVNNMSPDSTAEPRRRCIHVPECGKSDRKGSRRARGRRYTSPADCFGLPVIRLLEFAGGGECGAMDH